MLFVLLYVMLEKLVGLWAALAVSQLELSLNAEAPWEIMAVSAVRRFLLLSSFHMEGVGEK